MKIYNFISRSILGRAVRLSLIICAVLVIFPLVSLAQEEWGMNKISSVKTVQGRLDSIRPDKIVITCKVEGGEVQAYYLRNKNTRFINRQENRIKPGDIVEVTYEEIRWEDKSAKEYVKRIAESVRFLKPRAAEELKVQALGIRTQQTANEVIDEDGPQ